MAGKVTKGQKDVFEALEAEGGGCMAFNQLMRRHALRDDVLNIHEAVQSVGSQELPRLCKGLVSQVHRGLAAAQPCEDEPLEEGAAWAPEAVECLEGLASVVLGMLERGLPSQGYALLLPAAEALHDNVLLAAAAHPQLQDAISRFCELWWQQELYGREAVVAQTLPYLLKYVDGARLQVRALTSGRSSDIKRCYLMRTALPLLDYEDPSIVDLKRLLLRAAFAPAFLRNSQGRRYLSFLFTVHHGLIRELAAIIRNQIPSGRQSVLEAYGEVLFRAWRDCAGVCLMEVETVLQEMMQAAILASDPGLAASIRTVLGGIHSQKHIRGVDSLLLRLYEPILFRALVAPNAAVRCNALHVLSAAFPLQDADMEPEEVDELLTRQFGHLGDALDDGIPAVRKTAAYETSRLLNIWWELVPAQTATQFLKRLAGLAFDGTSAAVRAAAINGLSLLVDNALAQPMLKIVLPTLAPLIDDTSAKVQSALINLLMAVRSVRAVKFWEVVPVERLLSALAVAPQDLAERIQHLLLPSYFPDGAEGPARIAALLRRSPAAGRAFCGSLARSAGSQSAMPLEQLVALVNSLKGHLLASSRLLQGVREGRDKGVKRRADSEGAEEPPVDMAQPREEDETLGGWEALAEGLAELCKGLVESGAQEVSDALEEVFENGGLAELLSSCPSSRSRVAILSIAAAAPDLVASGEVRGRCLVSLAAAGRDVEGREAVALLTTAIAGVFCREKLISMLVRAFEHPDQAGRGQEAFRDAAFIADLGDDIRCIGCGSGENEDAILLCDGCNAAHHMHCLNPPISQLPEEDWFCPSCTETLERGLTLRQAVSYLGMLLEAQSSRNSLLATFESTGRELSRLIASLGNWVEASAANLASQLHEAVEADGEADGLLPAATQLLCRSTLHVALRDRGQAGAEGINPAKSLRTAVKAASSLLEGLTSRAQRNPAPEQSICNDNTSPAHKRPKQLHGLQGRKAEEAAETIVAVLSLLADVALLRVPGWTTAEDAKLPREASNLASTSVSVSRKFSSSPWTAVSPLAAFLENLIGHSAKFARFAMLSARPGSGAGAVRLFAAPQDQDEECRGGQDAHVNGCIALGQLIKATGGNGPLDRRCLGALRPHLPGLVSAAVTISSEGTSILWLKELLQALGTAISTLPEEDLRKPDLDYTEVVQDVAVLQPFLSAAKFLGHSKGMAVEVAAASASLMDKGDSRAALGGCHLLAMLSQRGSCRDGWGAPQISHAIEGHLESLRLAVESRAAGDPEGVDAAISSLRQMPLLWGISDVTSVVPA